MQKDLNNMEESMSNLDDYLAKIKRPLNFDQMQLVEDAYLAGVRDKEMEMILKFVQVKDKISLIHKLASEEVQNSFNDLKGELLKEQADDE